MNIFNTILVQPLANGLILFYNVLGENLGVAIIAFSLFLIVALRPLTKPYMESMKKMRDIAPKLEKLKEKYKGDQIKLAQAQSELYKQNNINPGAGCLPYLLQIIVLIAFFNLFSQTLTHGGDITENFNKLLYSQLQFTGDRQINHMFLHFDLTKPDVLSIPGIPFSLPGILLILASVAQFYSAKAMSVYNQANENVAKKTKSETDDIAVSMQKSMIYTLPIITLFVGMGFPSGLALYWLVFSSIQFYQQKNNNSLVPSWLTKPNMLQSVNNEAKK
jgi:YidC/Oxa1 family membrane protein insertase